MTPTGSPPGRRAVTAATLLEWPGIGRLAPPRRYPTGFDALDAALGGGIASQELVVLGGPPGVGKTTAALRWARWMAMAGTVVVYASYQHEERRLLGRLLAMELAAVAEPGDAPAVPETRRLLDALGRGGPDRPVDTAGSPLFQRTAARLRSYGDRLLLLQASPATGVAELRRLVDERAGHDVALFVDPLDSVPGPGGPAALRELAMAFDVAVVAVGADVAATPALEAEADVVVTVHGRFDAAAGGARRRRRCGRIAALMLRTRRYRG